MDGNNISEPPQLIVERKFSQIHPSHEHELLPPRALNDFFELNAFVVLGDPGAGKTTSFEQAAQSEADAIYTTVRNFITLHVDRFRNRTLDAPRTDVVGVDVAQIVYVLAFSRIPILRQERMPVTRSPRPLRLIVIVISC